ncbi:hypothetical protein VTO73DRAFT_12791 [Trametes versicolor]
MSLPRSSSTSKPVLAGQRSALVSPQSFIPPTPVPAPPTLSRYPGTQAVPLHPALNRYPPPPNAIALSSSSHKSPRTKTRSSVTVPPVVSRASAIRPRVHNTEPSTSGGRMASKNPRLTTPRPSPPQNSRRSPPYPPIYSASSAETISLPAATIDGLGEDYAPSPRDGKRSPINSLPTLTSAAS